MTTLTVHGRAVRLRPATAADTPLLVEVYAAGRADELDRASWQPGQREAFERMQFDLQDRQYRTAHPQGSFDVVEVDGQPAGRLYVSERSEDIRIVDIALLPAFQGQRIGSALLRAVTDRAAADGRTVSLHVETGHRASALYERLGFRQVEDRGIRRLLEWRSGERGLVAEAPGVAADGDQEERDHAEAGVAEVAGALAERGLRWAGEHQRELPPRGAVRAGPAELRAERGLREREGDLGVIRDGRRERLAHEAGEVVEVQPRSHAASLGEPR
ncbi:GNAT family N-acetyltransferase [Nocardioides sp. QY071]|uniref:GNAT family N-acetyltransferase n=1 Tax=Nocardioides sp. QY071 TaxID=3044187 RepID=UPI00249AF932|nr:GNAT family N-acetyltransferase [Nocardioides sp. QY071]WGY03961.1 GNAT family N-acetyltransferase [Nocardioides sp. QY071]